MKLIFLSNNFYSDFSHYKEILEKDNRPYIMLLLCYSDYDFALPFRSNIKHNNCFRTTDNGGIDFTKSVIVPNTTYLDSREPILRDNDFKIIKGKEFEIKSLFISYINKYKKHIETLGTDKAHKRHYDFCKYSTLQNYHNYLDIPENFIDIINNYLNQKRE